MISDLPVAMLSVDVEDWFHVDNLKEGISRESWSGRELRVERNVNTILDILDASNRKGTFFVLGWVAERLPGLVKSIHSRGHEVAAHGYGHDLIYELSPERFCLDVGKSKDILEDIIGSGVFGYRAPNFSITDWAIELLRDLGFRYDSSLYPTMIHDRYGKLTGVDASNSGYVDLGNHFYEVFLSTLHLFGQKIPWSGGAYFRMIPYPLFRRGVRAILQRNQAYCFYIHPWEFDPEQPRVANIRPFYRFRHYSNLDKTQERFARLVQDFSFQPIGSTLPSGLDA